jgi:ABC-type transport system substrate-binding protein
VRTLLLRILAAAVAVLLPVGGARVAAAPAAARSAAQIANTLVIDTTAEAESLDPALVTQASGYSVMSSIFDIGPRASGWRGPTGRDFLIPTNITLQN